MMTIMTSCDPIYLREHAPALMVSAVVSGHNFHLHVVNAPPKDLLFMDRLSKECVTIGQRAGFTPRITTSSSGFRQMLPPNTNQYESADRVMWACDRFFTAWHMLQVYTADSQPTFESLVIVDTDCVFLRPFDEPIEDVGLFVREPLKTPDVWESSGTKVAAGLVYVKNTPLGRYFLRNVTTRINQGPARWFLDQIAIAEASESTLTPTTLYKFQSNILDWEFHDESVIWTGKGPRKYTNEAYLAKKATFTAMLSHANL